MSRDFAKDRAICEAAAPYFNLILNKEWAPEDYEAIKEYLSAAPERWPAALDEIERLRAELDEIERLRAELELKGKWLRQENDLNRRLLIEKNELIRKISKAAHDEVKRLQAELEDQRARANIAHQNAEAKSIRMEELWQALEAIASIKYDNLEYNSGDAKCMRQIAETALASAPLPKETGIVRLMDDLGRVAIPKVVRAEMGVQEGDPLEILIDGDRAVLRRYGHEEQA